MVRNKVEPLLQEHMHFLIQKATHQKNRVSVKIVGKVECKL